LLHWRRLNTYEYPVSCQHSTLWGRRPVGVWKEIYLWGQGTPKLRRKGFSSPPDSKLCPPVYSVAIIWFPVKGNLCSIKSCFLPLNVLFA
jgi:hypothetical protein